MSLQEKLSKLSQNLQETQAEQEKRIREKELEPVRSRINELQAQKNYLELIKGSLEFMSEAGQGKGMREHASEVNDRAAEESKFLNTLLENNKEALQTMGIENLDQLLENPEFTDEPEVISYKKSKKDFADLELSNELLQGKLRELGVNFEDKDFSYDNAAKAIAEELSSLDNEILQEKINIPEGRVEIIENVAETLKENIPPLSFSKDEKTGTQILDIDHHNAQIIIQGGQWKFRDWKKAKLVPNVIDNLEEAYGKEIAKEALLKAYGDKVRDAFGEFDRITGNTDGALGDELKKISPEKAREAQGSYDEFKERVDIFHTTLQEKHRELGGKGIDFNPTHVQNYGGRYEEYSSLSQYKESDYLVDRVMNGQYTYPPKLNFDTLKDFIDIRKKQIEELTEDIKKLETKEDVYQFTNSSDAGISKAHGKILNNKFMGIIRPDDEVYRRDHTKALGLGQFGSYNEAFNYISEKAKERKEVERKMLQLIEEGIDANILSKELDREVAAPLPGMGINDVQNKISLIERNKRDALNVLAELVKLESLSPKEPVMLQGNWITVLSVDKQLQQSKSDLKTEEENLVNLRQEISDHKSKEPGWLGKGKWKRDLESLEQKEQELQKKISKIRDGDNLRLSKESAYHIPVDQRSDVGMRIIKQEQKQGTLEEILSQLRGQLTDIVNTKLPASQERLYNEYREIEERLSSY